MNDERFRDLCVGFVTSSLPDEERREFLRELARRGPAGREELWRIRELLGSVSLEADPVEPPAGLRERVMAVTREGPASEPAHPASEERGSDSRRRWASWIGAAAAAILLAFLGFQNLQLRDSLDATLADLDSARDRLARLDTLERRVRDVQEDLLTVAAPGTRSRLLNATEEAFPGRARVFVDPETGRALLFARELPVLPPDSVYQLWTIEGGDPESAGTFRPGSDRRARVEIAEAGRVLDADAVAVTVEPAPGQPAPTSQPILVAAAGTG